MTPTCVNCIFSQALRVCQTLHVDEATTKKVLDRVACMVPTWRLEETPPQVAAGVYPAIGKILGREDIYRDYKADATRRAQKLLPTVETAVNRSADRFEAALKAAVAGNVIDLAATQIFNLEDEVAKVFHTSFAIDDSAALRQRLSQAESVLVIGDNAGEHIFDKLMMQELKTLFPRISLGYVVRGKPIINDVTLAEAKAAGIDEIAQIIDSGVDTPGLDLARASQEFLERYEAADVIIAKGMGNYESLNDTSIRPTWFLLKIKCDVVAASLGKQVGDIICKGIEDV